MSGRGKTSLMSSGAAVAAARAAADKTVREKVVNINIPLPPREQHLAPPSGIRTASYLWLCAVHKAFQNFKCFTLECGKPAVLIFVRWTDQHDGTGQFSAVDAPYGHKTVSLAKDPDPRDWVVAWVDLQQGVGRSIDRFMFTWFDFAKELGAGARSKFDKIAAHIMQNAAGSCRKVDIVFLQSETQF